MVDLTLDARNNRKSYPAFQQFLASQRPPTLVLWGKNDPIFGPAAAEAIHRIVLDSRLTLFDTGHFALEEDGTAIASEITDFFAR